MSAYFSRLAQRSGVATTAANAASANVAPEWSEHSVEKTAPVSALISDTESSTSASAIDNKGIHSSEHSPPSATSQATNTPSKPTRAQQQQQKFDAVNATVNSSFLSNTLSTNSNFIESDSSQDSLNAETSVSLSIPNERGLKSEPFSTSAKHASVTFDQPLAIKSSSKESFAEYVAHSKAPNKAPMEGIGHTPVKARSIKSAPLNVELEIDNSVNRDLHTPAATPAHAVQSRPANVGIEQTKNIVSAPVQAPATSLQTPRAAPRSSIEVHIGKIELEIFSPTKKPADAPKALQMVAPRTAPASAFNPHRHYLRSR